MFKNSNHKGFKLGHRERTIHMEALEDRSLLSVNPLAAGTDAAAAVFAENAPAAQAVSADEVNLAAPEFTVAATGTTTAKVTITTAVEGAESYNVLYSTDSTFGEGATFTQNVQVGETEITGLTADTTYYFKAQSVGQGEVVSDFTEATSIKTDAEAPVVVEDAAITVDGKAVTVTFEDGDADSVRYKVSGTEKWTTKKVKAGTTTFTFNGKPGTTYDIELLKDGETVQAGATTVLAQPKVTLDKTSITDQSFEMKVDNFDDATLALADTAVVTINGVDYDVDLAPAAQGDEDVDPPVVVDPINVEYAEGVFTVTGLTSNTSYKATVTFKVTDANITSLVSKAVSVKTQITPYAVPTDVTAKAVSDTEVEVAWTPSDATVYTVEYSVKDSGKWSKATTKAAVEAGAETGSFKIQKLKGGNEYEVRVTANKDKTHSASAAAVAEETATTLATPKVTVDKASIGADTFQMKVANFEAFADADAAVVIVDNVEQSFAFEGEGEFDNGMTVSYNKEDGVLTFANAPSNTQQSVQVSFTKGECTTTPTKAAKVKTTKAAFAAPELTSVTATSDTTMDVVWEANEGQQYTIEYSVKDSGKWSKATTKAANGTATIQKLKGGTTYEVRVTANKSKDFEASAPSAVKEATTMVTPVITLDKATVTSDSFKLNLAEIGNAEKINVIIAGETKTIELDAEGKGSVEISGEGETAFTASYEEGALTFTNATPATQYKVQVSLTEGENTTSVTKAVSVKTAKAPLV